jgi:uncharacterized metal-binding protein
MTMSRLLLIPCAHVNKEGEIALRACYLLRSKQPRKVMIVAPSTIGASPLLLPSFGVERTNYVAVNGCTRRCVDKILESMGDGPASVSIVLYDAPSVDPKSAIDIQDDDILRAEMKLETELAGRLTKK